MEVWKIIILSKWVICRFHVDLPGCMQIQMFYLKLCSFPNPVFQVPEDVPFLKIEALKDGFI